MSDDNKNEKPDLGLPELPDELKDIPELQDLQKQGNPPEPKKPDPEEERRSTMNMWAASQFAYTLVGATLVFGYIGHWLGSLLGGGLWSIALMFILGGLGFGAEVWRMVTYFGNYDKKPKDHPPGDGKSKGDNQPKELDAPYDDEDDDDWPKK